ncbi:hypothetical protein [Planomonospora venezuelensis]|uniref:Sporulation protein YlmC with PRC-barrel domain n=1 Tax=Planomonospora venezuelensis TaxID=1999 RepID=A0A841DC53_PLAVE|nr:hypothetical protein [Planomonospora venezuelensis]MBB5966383.1 sporulation protein YlmC with PRC-barrel domain [Planomonospora venezuelensis]GIN02792.1 hypothetical protein Pve01_44500 [Planomonospora venezuelensis]
MRARVIHALLHLLDRQVVREGDGRLLCKADDLELASGEDGRPYVTAILAGPLALGPRVGGVPGRMMVAVTELLRPEERPGPHRIDMAHVTGVGSAVTVDRSRPELALERWTREHVVSRIPGANHAPGREAEPAPGPGTGRPPAPAPEREPAMRLSGLIRRAVQDASGEVVGQVADVRLTQDGPLLGRVQHAFAVSGLIVVPRHTGQLFGYERAISGTGPWLVRTAVRALHRGSVLVPWEHVADLGGDPVRLRAVREELTPLRELSALE